MLSELGQQTNAAEAMKKIASLRGEADTYRLLRQSGYRIEWIGKRADWKVGERQVSVKTKLPLDNNYEIVAQALLAERAVEENEIMRNLRSIRLRKMGSLSDTNLSHVVSVIQRKLCGVLVDWIRNGKRHGEGNAYRFVACKGGRELSMTLQAPDDDQAALGTLILNRGDSHGKRVRFSLNYDLNTWMYDSLNQQWFEKLLKAKLQEIQGCKETEAWINVIVHPRHEERIVGNLQMLRGAAECAIKEYDFPITICLYPGMEYVLKKPIVWSFGDSIGASIDPALTYSAC